MEKMTYIETLVKGVEEIANNHNVKSITENWEEDMQIGILDMNMGIQNVPLIADVRMLCSDLSLPYSCIYTTMFGIDIEIPYDWYKKYGNKKYKGGYAFWKKAE